MQDAEVLSLERIQELLEATEEVRFEGKRRQEVYDWMTRLMRQAGIPEAGQISEGAAAALHGEDDGAEPGAGDPTGRPVPEKQRGEGGGLPAQSVCRPVHAGRH